MHPITQTLSELSRRRGQYISERMLPYELKTCHALNLSQICGKPGISQDALTRQRGADKSSIARQVATLEEEGLITRTPCNDDKRVMKLYPTDKALELLPKITEVLDTWEALLTQDLTEAEIDVLTGLLDRMRLRAASWREVIGNETTE